MSKRFGRNQKRKMRAALAETAAVAQRWERAADQQKNKARELAEELRDVARKLTEYTVFLAPQVTRVDSPLRRMTMAPKVSAYAAADSDMAIRESLRTIDLMTTELDVEHDPYTRAVHINFMFGDDKLSYAVSEEGMRALGAREVAWYATESMRWALETRLVKQGVRP